METSPPSQRHALIAVPDRTTADTVGRALSLKRFVVSRVADGKAAAEAVQQERPDLIVYDWSCPLSSPLRFAQAVRGRLETADTPIIFLGAPGLDVRAAVDPRDAFLPRGSSIMTILFHVDRACRRAADALATNDPQQLEGDLAMMGLFDLLQVLKANRRTGCLTLANGGPCGRIWMNDGEIKEAETGRTRGTKALYRLFELEKGRFSFAPDARPRTSGIDGGMDALLMEGMRRLDERRKLLQSFPQEPFRLLQNGALAPAMDAQHPTAARVWALLNDGPGLDEVLDRSEAGDLETLEAVSLLLAAGVARCSLAAGERAGAGDVAKPHDYLLASGAARRVKASIRARTPDRTLPSRPKMLITSSRTSLLRFFIRKLQLLPDFAPVGRPLPVSLGFGTLGRLALAPDLNLAVVIPPVDATARPLMRLLTGGAVCVIRLAADDDSGELPVVDDGEAAPRMSGLPALHITTGGVGSDGACADGATASIELHGVRGDAASFSMRRPEELRALLAAFFEAIARAGDADGAVRVTSR